ncbi:Eukaryotic translation initiation factor 4 gamma 1 [Takifugu flavidus]|uniref:Eukaryotic translation initiation factor 4 gamma 1 n=1 Tax=Takifugu flavidus TaxID=433684 RepID=A0A5C6NS33_9TELE|nr:Eukaryotic translation initiation factor 4 gamma 1 [Takifugu flavidus]
MTTQETLRQLRQIVYKLTPENFDELMESVADLKFDTVKKLWESIKLIFFKVVLKPSSIGLYAKMCCCLKELKVDTMTGESVTFCRLLETHCQQQLKKVHSGDEDLNQKEKVLVSEQNEAKFRNLKLELEEARLKVHHRLLISMKFIGELFKVKMLTLDKVQTFVLELLRDDQRELPMKCLCMLLSTIGEELDTGNTKPLLDDYCCKLENIATESKTSLSIQHILRDVLDLRKLKEHSSDFEKWCKRRVYTSAYRSDGLVGSDCENWRSGNDRNRDHGDHQKGSPDDRNWRSSKRDQAERCDRSPDQHKVIEHRVADSNGEKKETEVQHMRNADEHQCSPPPPLSTSMLAPV